MRLRAKYAIESVNKDTNHPVTSRAASIQKTGPQGISPTGKLPQGISPTGKFWLEDWSALFQNFDILPECGMQNAERLNTMTRLIFVIAIILAIVGVGSWLLFLILGLILVVILWYNSERKSKIENYRCQQKSSTLCKGSYNHKGRKIHICPR